MQTKMHQITSDHWDYPGWSNRQDRQRFNLEAFTDANWAGCKVSRKSTTSYMIFMNGNLLISSCKLQSSIALSSAESELRTLCKLQWRSKTFARWQFVEISDWRRCADDSIQRQLGSKRHNATSRTRKAKAHPHPQFVDPRFGSRENYLPMQGSNSNQPVRSEHEETFTRTKEETDGFDSHRISDWHGDREH